MKDEIVKFETACLAKEKGFDWECREWYSKDGVCKTLVYYQGDDGWIKNSDIISGYNILTTAPTQSLLQRWLREVHNINIIIESSNLVGVKHNFYNYLIWCRYESYDVYQTYEEALEAGLIKALELI